MSSAIKLFQGRFGRVALLDMDAPLVEHAHHHCHVLLKAGGADSGFLVRGERQPLTDATAVLVNAWEPHAYQHDLPPGQSTLILALYIEPTWLAEIQQSLTLSGHPRFFPRNCVAIDAHTKKIAEAIAAKIGPMEALPPQDPNAQLAAFTNKQMATGTWSMIQQDLAESGVTDMTASYGPRLVEQERCAYLRPMVLHADSPSRGVASKEYMFPFVSVVECPQKDMIKSIGQTLIGTALTADPSWIDDLTNAVNIDRLNIGAVATNRLNWLQPHEGNLTEFLFRNRAYQFAS